MIDIRTTRPNTYNTYIATTTTSTTHARIHTTNEVHRGKQPKVAVRNTRLNIYHIYKRHIGQSGISPTLVICRLPHTRVRKPYPRPETFAHKTKQNKTVQWHRNNEALA